LEKSVRIILEDSSANFSRRAKNIVENWQTFPDFKKKLSGDFFGNFFWARNGFSRHFLVPAKNSRSTL
jgi:hypothetical protein